MQFDLELSICDDDEEEDMMVMARLWPFNLSSKHFILWSEKDTLKQAGKEIETQDCPNLYQLSPHCKLFYHCQLIYSSLYPMTQIPLFPFKQMSKLRCMEIKNYTIVI